MFRNDSKLLSNPIVRAALRQAWLDSDPGVMGGHEEGGFIVRDTENELAIIRWPRGDGNRIVVPPHPDSAIGEMKIIASFHTHPNTGPDFLQEPSATDIRSVRDDPDLKSDSYEGEFVVSNKLIYRIAPDGEIGDVAETRTIFDEQ